MGKDEGHLDQQTGNSKGGGGRAKVFRINRQVPTERNGGESIGSTDQCRQKFEGIIARGCVSCCDKTGTEIG